MNYKNVRLNSWIFVPANKFNKIEKIENLKPDVYILDLEDSVAPNEKVECRKNLFSVLLKPKNKNVYALRINQINSAFGLNDFYQYLESDLNLPFLFLPKAEDFGTIKLVANLLFAYQKKTLIVPIIETVEGMELVKNWPYSQINQQVYGFMYGGADMSASMQCNMKSPAVTNLKTLLVQKARVLDFFIIDTPFFEITNLNNLKLDTIFHKQMGFDGRTIIHPSHIEIVNQVYEVTEVEIEWAKKILKENEKGSGKIDGVMVDEAVAKNARIILNNSKKP